MPKLGHFFLITLYSRVVKVHYSYRYIIVNVVLDWTRAYCAAERTQSDATTSLFVISDRVFDNVAITLRTYIKMCWYNVALCSTNTAQAS